MGRVFRVMAAPFVHSSEFSRQASLTMPLSSAPNLHNHRVLVVDRNPAQRKLLSSQVNRLREPS